MLALCSGRADLQKETYKDDSAYRYGSWNCCYDRDRMCSQCLRTPADLCYGIWYADGCACGDGNCSQSEHHKYFYICDFCSSAVQYSERSACISYCISYL